MKATDMLGEELSVGDLVIFDEIAKAIPDEDFRVFKVGQVVRGAGDGRYVKLKNAVTDEDAYSILAELVIKVPERLTRIKKVFRLSKRSHGPVAQCKQSMTLIPGAMDVILPNHLVV